MMSQKANPNDNPYQATKAACAIATAYKAMEGAFTDAVNLATRYDAAEKELEASRARVAQLESEQTLTALNALAAVAAYDASEHSELHAKAAAVIVPQAAGPIGRAAEALVVMSLGTVAEKRAYLRRRGWRELSTGWETANGKLGGAVIDGAMQMQVKADAEAVRGAVKALGV